MQDGQERSSKVCYLVQGIGKKGEKNWCIMCQTDERDESASEIEGMHLLCACVADILLASVEAEEELSEIGTEPEEAT